MASWFLSELSDEPGIRREPMVRTVLGKIHQHQSIHKRSADHPNLTGAQLALAQRIQAQDNALTRLYQTLQTGEAVKPELERELINSFTDPVLPKSVIK
jgi:hypothetical protein